jgi:hypothetical protein
MVILLKRKHIFIESEREYENDIEPKVRKIGERLLEKYPDDTDVRDLVCFTRVLGGYIQLLTLIGKLNSLQWVIKNIQHNRLVKRTFGYNLYPIRKVKKVGDTYFVRCPMNRTKYTKLANCEKCKYFIGELFSLIGETISVRCKFMKNCPMVD